MLMTIKQPCGAFIQKQGHNQCLQGLNGYRFNIKCQFGSVCPRVCVCVCWNDVYVHVYHADIYVAYCVCMFLIVS